MPPSRVPTGNCASHCDGTQGQRCRLQRAADAHPVDEAAALPHIAQRALKSGRCERPGQGHRSARTAGIPSAPLGPAVQGRRPPARATIKAAPLSPLVIARSDALACGHGNHEMAGRQKNAYGCRVQHRRSGDAARLALSTRPRPGAVADHRDGARLFRGEGDVPRPLRGSVRRGRARRARVRQSQLRGERRRAAPGNRPLAAGQGLSRRHHLCADPRARPTAHASASGAPATVARTCWCSAPRIAASSASHHRCR